MVEWIFLWLTYQSQIYGEQTDRFEDYKSLAPFWQNHENWLLRMKLPVQINKTNILNTLTQQHAVTVICMVFLPGWQTSLRYRGLWEVLFSPRSMLRGFAFTLTVTDAGQLVFIWRSSWWKHFSCNSKSDLKMENTMDQLASWKGGNVWWT